MLFTERLTVNKPVLFESNKERIININTISLESSDDIKESIDIYCENKRKKESFKICSLKKNSKEIYSTNLNLDIHNFKDKYEIYLKTKSKNVIVNIIGFYEEEESEEQKPVKSEEVSKKNKKEKEIEKEKNNSDGGDIQKGIEFEEVKNENKEDKGSEEDENSDSNSDSDENEILEDKGPSVSLVDLFKKTRKEKPQDLKPVTLKNLASTSNDKNKKMENKNKKKKIDNANNEKKNEKKIDNSKK